MHIIFGEVLAKELSEKYTVLELDTFRFIPSGVLQTAYCVIETIPINELPLVDSKRALHQNLMVNYRRKDWTFCSQAIDHLIGSWGNEMDSFYEDIRSRVNSYTENNPGSDWDGIIEKVANPQ